MNRLDHLKRFYARPKQQEPEIKNHDWAFGILLIIIFGLVISL